MARRVCRGTPILRTISIMLIPGQGVHLHLGFQGSTCYRSGSIREASVLIHNYFKKREESSREMERDGEGGHPLKGTCQEKKVVLP
jgi:hypothetical protein